MDNTDKNEAIVNPGVKYDPDMRLTNAVAAVVFMHGERKKRGFGKPEEIDFSSFSKRWNNMDEDEREKFAQRLAHLAGRVAAGPGPGTGVPVNVPLKESPLDHAVILAEEEGFGLTDAGLAVVVAGAAAKKKDEDIVPGTREYFTTSRKNPDGTESIITIPIPQYDPGEVKGVLDRMSRLSSSPAPVSPSKP